MDFKIHFDAMLTIFLSPFRRPGWSTNHQMIQIYLKFEYDFFKVITFHYKFFTFLFKYFNIFL